MTAPQVLDELRSSGVSLSLSHVDERPVRVYSQFSAEWMHKTVPPSMRKSDPELHRKSFMVNGSSGHAIRILKKKVNQPILLGRFKTDFLLTSVFQYHSVWFTMNWRHSGMLDGLMTLARTRPL